MSDEEQARALAEALPADQQWPVTVKLKHPVQFGSESIAELVFRRGKLGDLKGVSVNGVPPIDQLLLMASRLCGKPLAALEMLDSEDGAEVIGLALGFFGRCLAGTSKR